MDFGGPWTEQKLKILERYLDAYTTALKNQRFELVYIDAFAGTGHIKSPDRDAIDRDAIDRDAIDRDAIDRDAINFLQGSTTRALNVSDNGSMN